MKLGPLNKQFCYLLLVLGILLQCGLMLFSRLQKQDLKELAPYSILWVPVSLDRLIEPAVSVLQPPEVASGGERAVA